jgi:hydantoinase/carbamoylase family amidase
MAARVPPIDRERSAARIARDIETLSGRGFTTTDEAIRRYAYTPEYRRTLDWFTAELREIGFDVTEDPVGTLVARNRPPGTRVFGVGSHCDSNRNGGRYDGTLGVVTALEVCRLAAEHHLDLPLQLVSFLEEEGSGFGQMLLGSRIMLQRVDEDDLRERFRSLDDGRSFWAHAEAAGYEPARWRESMHVLDDLVGWIEMHIEQARVLQDTGKRIGVVEAIAGYVHADVRVHGRGDHAGATPMDLRLDPTLVLAETALELERLARAAGQGTVGTIGEIEVDPGLINAIASSVRFSLDIRGPVDDAYRGVASDVGDAAVAAAERRGMRAEVTTRQTLPATPLDRGIVDALVRHAEASGEPFTVMHSGAAHDTMCVAERVPSAMVFVPCVDGISHHPDEDADPADAALAAEIILGAVADLTA